MADSLVDQAAILYNNRRRRAEYFPDTLFTDIGWDLLLWLFIENEQGRRATLRDAAEAIHTSKSLASRWLAVLRDMNLVDHRSTEEDVMLASDGRQRMLLFLSDTV